MIYQCTLCEEDVDSRDMKDIEEAGSFCKGCYEKIIEAVKDFIKEVQREQYDQEYLNAVASGANQ